MDGPIPNTGFTPAIAYDGTITVNGRYAMFAVSPAGDVKWKYDFPLIDNVTQAGVRQTTGSHRSAPTIARDGTIYVNTKQVGTMVSRWKAGCSRSIPTVT